MSNSSSNDDELVDMYITLLTLRKPTELKKVIDSVPKPERAIPKNGLPMWYRLGLESKLPVPKIPKGMIVFSRGKIGEDIRRVGLGVDTQRPSFDLTDPYCRNVSYDYDPVHDPNLASFFAQKANRNRMKVLGYLTKDGRAVCSLKEFNQYRKYLYNRFMDRIHFEMDKLDQRLKDDLTLKRVDRDVARKQLAFNRSEREREKLQRHMQRQGDEFAEKKRLAKEQEKKVQARIKYLIEFNEKQRKERAARVHEKAARIRQRVQAAAELELRRKITMIKQWRENEKRRLDRLRADKMAKQKRADEEADKTWCARVEAQNKKIEEEALLLKMYTEDMAAAAMRRTKKAEIYAYNIDLELQRIRLANLKVAHGGTAKRARLVWKMGQEFMNSKRGVKGMTEKLAQEMAQEAMQSATSTPGDALMMLGQARSQMDKQTYMPKPPIKLLDEVVEKAVVVFARRRVDMMLRKVEQQERHRASLIFFEQFRPSKKRKSSSSRRSHYSQSSRRSQQIEDFTRAFSAAANAHRPSFGQILKIEADDFTAIDLKRARDRPPTPVPSKTKLAEVTFFDKLEDLPDPVAIPTFLPERKKLLEMVNAAAKLITKLVSQRVDNGMDTIIFNVTLPKIRHRMEWGEAVEALAEAVVDNRVHHDCGELRRAAEFLTYRILCSLNAEIKKIKKERLKKEKEEINEEESPKEFYNPRQMRNPPENVTAQSA